MRHSIEPKDRICAKGYGVLSFAKNMDKNLSNKYGQKLLDSAKSLPHMHKKLLQREQFKKQQKQLVI